MFVAGVPKGFILSDTIKVILWLVPFHLRPVLHLVVDPTTCRVW